MASYESNLLSLVNKYGTFRCVHLIVSVGDMFVEIFCKKKIIQNTTLRTLKADSSLMDIEIIFEAVSRILEPKQERQALGNLASIFHVVMSSLKKSVNVMPGILIFTERD